MLFDRRSEHQCSILSFLRFVKEDDRKQEWGILQLWSTDKYLGKVLICSQSTSNCRETEIFTCGES